MHGPILAMILLSITWQYPLKLACPLNLFAQESKGHATDYITQDLKRMMEKFINVSGDITDITKAY